MTASKSFYQTLDLFRNPALARNLMARIGDFRGQATLMEVCGTHTVSLMASGISRGMPDSVRLVSGPGCPVCVTPAETVETAVGLARKKGLLLFCFGDMLRVPGVTGSIESARAKYGARVRIMYSPLEALEAARNDAASKIVSLGVGFETTIPLFSSLLMRARRLGVTNLYLLPAFRLIPPVLNALAGDPGNKLDGFILPGHVSSVIGENAYRFLAERYGKPGVIAGFESADMLHAILALLDMIEKKAPAIKNAYTRCVSTSGNRTAMETINTVFEPAPAEWRGMGTIPASGLRLRKEFSEFDAAPLVDFEIPRSDPAPGCRCGEVISGRCAPPACPLFKRRCTPSDPLGPCMVSSEGTCAAYFRYGGHK